jgi:hypothetical protein
MNLPGKAAAALCLIAATAAPAFADITVSSPADNSQVASHFNLSARAAKCSSETVTSMRYSLDSTADITVSGSSLLGSISASPGRHTLKIKASGARGARCDASVYFTVVSAPYIPPNAISATSLQTLPTWQATDDAGATGTATGTMNLVTSPSLDDGTLEFVTQYTGSGDERYFTVFGDDTTSQNFVWDGWLYLTDSSTIANLEMDMNQVMDNGQTVIYGVQCDGYAGTWDFTENAGTPQNYDDEWVNSSAPCNVSNWTLNAWHHVQVAYSRDDSGNVTYDWVWFDGVQSALNATVPSSFALGWASVLLTNVEIDGVGSSGSSTVYLDDLTIYRW